MLFRGYLMLISYKDRRVNADVFMLTIYTVKKEKAINRG